MLELVLSHRDGVDADTLQRAGLDPAHPRHDHLLRLVGEIQDFPRHLSIHPGGFLLGHEPVHDLVPVENGAMAERTVIQWDKEDIEALGLLKVDVLALGMLSAIRKSLQMVHRYQPAIRSISDIPKEDQSTYRMLQAADTVGVFQIESRAQMSMLPRLKPACFYDLVIEIAIVRPGPIQGDMVHPYLRRKQGLEQITYPSAAIRSVLERTLGVPIFQEQVMQIAMVAAGFTGSEADMLRRSMAAWSRRGGMEHMHQRLVSGMRERGYSEEFAEQIFQQIRALLVGETEAPVVVRAVLQVVDERTDDGRRRVGRFAQIVLGQDLESFGVGREHDRGAALVHQI